MRPPSLPIAHNNQPRLLLLKCARAHRNTTQASSHAHTHTPCSLSCTLSTTALSHQSLSCLVLSKRSNMSDCPTVVFSLLTAMGQLAFTHPSLFLIFTSPLSPPSPSTLSFHHLGTTTLLSSLSPCHHIHPSPPPQLNQACKTMVVVVMAENAVIGAAAAAVVVVVCGAVQRRALRRFQTAPATAATTRARKRERERERSTDT